MNKLILGRRYPTPKYIEQTICFKCGLTSCQCEYEPKVSTTSEIYTYERNEVMRINGLHIFAFSDSLDADILSVMVGPIEQLIGSIPIRWIDLSTQLNMSTAEKHQPITIITSKPIRKILLRIVTMVPCPT